METTRTTIGELCNTISDTYRGKDEFVVLVNTSDVLEGKILNHQCVENKNLKGQFKKKFKHNDILYSEIRPANKRFAFVSQDDTHNYIASTKLMVLRPVIEKVRPRYLYHLLKSQAVIDELQHLAETRSGTFPQITFSSELAPFEVMLPMLADQDRIISVLDCIEGKIDCNNHINRNLSEQLEALYLEWFSADCNGVLADLCDYTTARVDVEQLTEGTYYSTENMLPNKAGATVASGLPTTGKTPACFPGNTLISNIRPYFKKIVYCHEKAGCSADVLCFVAKNPMYASYIYATLYVDKFFDYMVAGSKGTKMPRGDKQQIMQYPVHIPTEEEIEMFGSMANNSLETIRSKTHENERLGEMRDGLLPKLMSGELDVSELKL